MQEFNDITNLSEQDKDNVVKIWRELDSFLKQGKITSKIKKNKERLDNPAKSYEKYCRNRMKELLENNMDFMTALLNTSVAFYPSIVNIVEKKKGIPDMAFLLVLFFIHLEKKGLIKIKNK